jgi:hypothetical protein
VVAGLDMHLLPSILISRNNSIVQVDVLQRVVFEHALADVRDASKAPGYQIQE